MSVLLNAKFLLPTIVPDPQNTLPLHRSALSLAACFPQIQHMRGRERVLNLKPCWDLILEVTCHNF